MVDVFTYLSSPHTIKPQKKVFAIQLSNEENHIKYNKKEQKIIKYCDFNEDKLLDTIRYNQKCYPYYNINTLLYNNSAHIVYVLRLENDKFYVGKSSRFYKRICDHNHKKGSAVTRKYKPKYIEIAIKCQNTKIQSLLETEIYYMLKKCFGINYVRCAGNTSSVHF